MSKRVLTVLLAVLLAAGIFGTVARAGVEGSFTFDISLKPQHAIPYYDCTYISNVNINIVVLAHELKADLEDLQTELGGYWILGEDYKQPLLELADYNLPGDEAAIKAKAAEVMGLLDGQVASLKTDLAAIPSDICTEVTTDWVDELSTEIVDMFDEISTIVTKTTNFARMAQWADVEKALDTIKDTTPNPVTGWIEFDLDSDSQTEYVKVEDIDEVKSEWEAFTDTATALKDKAAKMYKKYALWEKYEDELHLAALDCTDPEGLDEVFTALNRLNNAAVELDKLIDEFLKEAQTIKDDYKKFLTKQVGLDNDETTPFYVNMITTPADIGSAWEAIAGPTTGAIYEINYEMEAVKTKKLAIEKKLDTIKAKYALQTKLAGFIAAFDPIYDKLQLIINIHWSQDKICTWKYKKVGPFEYQKFKFDFEGKLLLDLTFSGLTISNNLAMGLGGIEHYIIGISTTLGALDLKDEFWFAAPYAKYVGPYGQSNYLRVGTLQFVKKRVDATIAIGGLEAGTHLVFEDLNFNHPYPYPAAVPPKYGFGTWFTLKGVTVSGIGVESLTALNVDPQVKDKVKKYSEYGRVVKQPDFNINTTKLGHGFITESYTIGAPTPTYLNSTITVDNVTAKVTWDTPWAGLVVGPWNWFVKELTITNNGPGPRVIVVSSVINGPWFQRFVNCRGGYTATTSPPPPEWFFPYTPESFTLFAGESAICYVGGQIDGGPVGTSYTMFDDVAVFKAETYRREAPWLTFTVEKINITGIPLGPLTLDSYLEFRPGTPIANTLDASFTLMGLDVVAELYTEDITTFNISSLTVKAALDTYFTITATDGDGTLMLDNPKKDSIKVVSSIPVQAATLSNSITIKPTVGITSANFGISIPVGIGTFTSKVYFTGSPMKMSKWSFALSSTVGGLTFDMSSTFKMTGLDKANISIGVPFSV